ncbi:thap domain protein [Anaeramoeba ignava]|uniref:Thap domain protein n=1 Tax=Anaeramoeba ignava TaxID=1746090 RepID=A0A9Q0LWW7_ANAIG|nr:thap domain protein [Anaeramoeba ignava]
MDYNNFHWWSKGQPIKGAHYFKCSRPGCPAILKITSDGYWIIKIHIHQNEKQSCLNIQNQLLLFLIWNHYNFPYSILGFIWRISDSTAKRYINKLLPILAKVLRDEIPKKF